MFKIVLSIVIRTLLEVLLYPEFYPTPFSKFLLLRPYELNIYPSVVNTVINREVSGGNMPVSKSVFLTYSYGTLEKFHVGDFSLLLEMQTSTNTLKSNLVLSCKVEYLHFLQPRDVY